MFFKKMKGTPTEDRILLVISFFLRLSLLYAFGLALWLNHWLTAFVSLSAYILTFIPSLIEHNYKISLPTEFELVIVLFIYMALYLGNLRGYYIRYWWWDNILHTLSGIALGFIGFLIVYTLYRAGKISTKPIFLALFAFCFALSLGAVWEIFEFNADNLAHTNLQRRETGIYDTMNDIMEDAAGALFTSIVGFFYLKGVKGSGIFDIIIKKFVKNNPHLFEEKEK